MNPLPIERLEKTLARVAREQGLAQERLRRSVSFLALCGVLERAVSEGILENYYLKGGVAMEYRVLPKVLVPRRISTSVCQANARCDLGSLRMRSPSGSTTSALG